MKNVPILFAVALTILGCASAGGPGPTAEVRIVNVYRTGAEEPPREMAGCEAKGSVTVSLPELQSSGLGAWDPAGTYETIQLKAARKGADTAFVSVPPGTLQVGRRRVRASIFFCGTNAPPG